MPTDPSQLHHIDLAGEPGERISSRVMKMQVADQKAVTRLAEQGIQARAAYRPSETALELIEDAERRLRERDFARAAGDVLGLVGDTRHASVSVYPRGSEGEDLAGSHAGSQADEEGESYFRTLGAWPLPCPVAQPAEKGSNFTRINASLARRVVTWGAEATERAVTAPAPLISSKGEDVGQEVGVALNAAFADDLEAGVAPDRKVMTFDATQRFIAEVMKVAEEGVDALDLPRPAALVNADLVPVLDERVSERLLGKGATLHRKNLGLSRTAPEGCFRFGLEGARLANSVPLDLDAPALRSPADVCHARECKRDSRGTK